MLSVSDSKNKLPDSVLEKTIIIIGAGMSGLTCGEKLQKRGFKNVKILEASDRHGGRIHTVITDEIVTSPAGLKFYEFGPNRVQNGTYAFRTAEKADEITNNSEEYSAALEKIKLFYYKQDALAIDSLRIYFTDRSLFPKDFNEVLNDKEFLKVLEHRDPRVVRILKSHMHGAYKWYFGMAYEYVFGRTQAELKCGYNSIVRTLEGKLPENTFARKEVVTVNWTDFLDKNFVKDSTKVPKIKVRCRDGSTYEADHVVIALPLGVIKENYRTFFKPSLSEDKLHAIHNLDFVTVDKIFLEFERPCWGKTDVYHVIWNERMERHFDDHSHPSGKDPISWLKYINRFEYTYSNENALTAWVWGDGAVTMETLPIEEIKCCCMKLLAYLTNRSWPTPKYVNKTMWYLNTFFRGSVIFDPSRPIYTLNKKITESITVNNELLILFTGDVREYDVISSVQGAREGGIRAARELYTHYATPAGIDVGEREMLSD